MSGHRRPPADCRRADTADAVAPEAILAVLREDPTLRFSERGRLLLRWLEQSRLATRGWDTIGDGVPSHCLGLVARMAWSCAQAWSELATRVEQGAPVS